MNRALQYFDQAGRPTVEALKWAQGLEERLQAAEMKLAAIAAIAGPSGGATTDAEARAAIALIIGAAG